MIRLITMLLCNLSPSYRLAMAERERVKGYRLYLARKAAKVMSIECLLLEEGRWQEDRRWYSYTGMWRHMYTVMGPGYLPLQVWEYLDISR